MVLCAKFTQYDWISSINSQIKQLEGGDCSIPRTAIHSANRRGGLRRGLCGRRFHGGSGGAGYIITLNYLGILVWSLYVDFNLASGSILSRERKKKKRGLFFLARRSMIIWRHTVSKLSITPLKNAISFTPWAHSIPSGA